MKTILVVEDETPVRDVLCLSLERAGYIVAGADTGRNAMRELDNYVPDLIVLDVGLPDIDGLELLHNWRREDRTRAMPVIIVTGRADERDRVSGLRAGADDYVTKPFSRDELLARIETVFRRVSPSDSKEILEVNGLRLDSASIRVTANDKPVYLGPIGFRLLHYFMAQPNRVHTRDQIIERVWRKDYVEPRAVDVQIRRLRCMLADEGYPGYIQTIRGVGYRFAEPG